MLRFQDSTAAIDEPKTARMEQRTKPSVKAQIQQAAALLGIDETTFGRHRSFMTGLVDLDTSRLWDLSSRAGRRKPWSPAWRRSANRSRTSRRW